MFRHEEVVERQLQLLQDERRSYVSRLQELIAVQDRQAEVRAYLNMIEAVNDAAIKLARDWQCRDANIREAAASLI